MPAADPLQVTVQTFVIQEFPIGDSGVSAVPPSSSDYICRASGTAGTTISPAGCQVNMPRSVDVTPRIEIVNVTVAYGDFSAPAAIFVFRPALSLSVGSTQLRRLTDSSCTPAVFETTQMRATAAFVHPDSASQRLEVDVTSIAEVAITPADALQVSNGVVSATAPVAGARISLTAAPTGSGNTSVTLSVLNEQTCIDALVPVVTSAAKLEVLDNPQASLGAYASNVTVRLSVQQNFTDPGDRGSAAVYAVKGFSYMDVTSQARTLPTTLQC